ncbi:hypothetical protein [Streptomyces cavernicola]|uniref:Lipoprotein n=1 Tax=Streptomyces cavernicola TaxID=3043613 RepID=A0ABT6SJA1_9ACTN|nr:hypothetical protein [Streptomyces sp. B-S-A6]MDI3407737.1 hypothetical protein [Streptomyces sp. B-S-A6]
MAANRKVLATAVACAAALVGVTGCFGDKDPYEGMSADKIADKASKATSAVDSVKLSAEGKQSGKPTSIEFEIAKGGSCNGEMKSADMGRVDIRVVDKTSYMKGDAAYWKGTLGDEATAQKVGDRWVKVPSGQSDDMCDLKSLFKEGDLDGVKRGEDSEVDGTKAVTLTKKKSGGETVTFYVAAEGEPFFLRAVTKGGDEPNTMNFSGYNEKIEVEAPPASEIADMQDLIAGS